MANDTQKLTVSEKFGYGLGDMASNLYWQMFMIFMAMYYTDVFGLSPAEMGTLMAVTFFANGFVDPLIGVIADRTKTRWGHFRPFLLWLCVPMAIAAVLAFHTPGFGPTGKLVYAYVTASLMMVMYSAINIPYSAMLGVLSPSSTERTSASSYRFVLALIPVFIIVSGTMRLSTLFGGHAKSPFGWTMAMVCFAAFATVLFLVTFATAKERVQPPAKQKTSLNHDLKDLVGNKPWVILCIVGVAFQLYANIRGQVIAYYFDYVVVDGKKYFEPVMWTGAACFVAGVMITSPLSKMIGKRRLYLLSLCLTVVTTTLFYFIPKDNIVAIWGLHGIISVCAAPTAPLLWAMYADTADYSEWKGGRRATGLVFSAASVAMKLGLSCASLATGLLLAFFEFQPNVAQTPRTENGMIMMMSIIPAIGAFVAGIAVLFYKLDEPTVKQMGEELATRRAAEPAAEGAAVA
jgi:glycoside/pentoside/hexuronide:cation symporter, GPH family